MREKTKKSSRAEVIAVIIVCTLLFAAILAGIAYYNIKLPVERQHKIEIALSEGKTDLARELAGKLSDESLVRQYNARADYVDAKKLMSEGKWLEAESIFLTAGEVEDASALARKCRYNYAEELLTQGDYITAGEEFKALGGFEDSLDRYDECRYLQALKLRDEDKLTEALVIFNQLGDYRDSRSILEKIAVEVTGLQDVEQAVAMMSGMSEEDIALQAELAGIRASLPQSVVAAGFFHTAAVTAWGEVLACGDNSCGQCDVSGIEDAVAVAAGAYHTAVLLENGTVKCVGRAGEGQCATEEWTDIIAISAGDWCTVGLKKDGTIVYTGKNESDEIQSWQGVAAISAGSQAVCAVRSNGALLIYPKQTVENELGNVIAADCNTGFTAALYADGSVRCSRADTSKLKNAVALSCSANGVVIIRADGTADGYFFKQRDALNLELPGKAVALDAGATHIVFALEDGSVYVTGENDCGQAETSGWRLR